ncbi:MAG TPA: hypothetical protein VGF99_10695, partial [Myxococcota bacterium]
ARLPNASGSCAQIKSLRSRDEADSTAAAIRAATSLPVSIIDKDLGARGTWFRLCVGAEPDAARLIAHATRWTSTNGVLAPFLDPPTSADEPRFHVLTTPAGDPRRPTPAQARALVERSSTGALAFAGEAASPLLVGTGPLGEGKAGSRVVVVDAAGARVPLDPAPPPGCASCALAEQASPVVSRSVLGVGELLPNAGDEILVDEETASGARFLAVLTTDGGRLRRAGAVLLAEASNGVILRGEAHVVEGDGDADREVAITRLELRTMQAEQGTNLCALETRAELWGTGTEAARGLRRLDLRSVVAANAADVAVVDFITALDGAGDATAASRACAEALADRPASLVTQLCLQRIRSLVADGRLVDAVNAAGALAERSSGLRAAVAGPLFAAMSALDGDARLSSSPYDCTLAPLVTSTQTRSVDETIKLARARLAERLSLADVNDAVFVTASRDFGADTPVGAIATRWMERLRLGQPARHAAIEAALLPPPPEATNDLPAAPAVDDAGPGFGGAP